MSSVRLGLCFAAFNFIQSCLADTPKSSKPSSTPKGCTMITWANLGVVDYLRSGALVIAFLAVLVSDKRGRGNARGVARGNNMWVNAEVVSFFVCGLACFFFPTQFLEYITKTPLNSHHILFTQVIASFLVGAAVTTVRLQASLQNDSVVYTCWLASRLAGSAAIFCFLLRAHISMDVFRDQNVSFVLLAVFLWFVGCVWQFFTTDKIGGIASVRGISSGINFYLMADLLLVLTQCLTQLAHPSAPMEWFTNFTPDALNIHLLQVGEIIVIAFSLQVSGAFFYANDEDKRQIFFGRLATKTSLNAMHIYTIQAIGCALIGVAVTTGRSQSSLENDAAVYTSWLTSRLAGSGAILCFLMRAHSQMDVFTDQNVSFVLLAVFLWFVGCVWQFFTTDKIGGIGGIRGTNSGINFYLMLELCLNFVAAVDYLGHPQAPFDYLFDSFKADALNLHLLQVIAVFVLFMGSLPLLGAFFYANDEDKRQIFFGRLVTFGLLLPCLGLHVWKNFALTRGGYMFMCIGIPLQLAILLRGYFISDGKVKTR